MVAAGLVEQEEAGLAQGPQGGRERGRGTQGPVPPQEFLRERVVKPARAFAEDAPRTPHGRVEIQFLDGEAAGGLRLGRPPQGVDPRVGGRCGDCSEQRARARRIEQRDGVAADAGTPVGPA